MSGAVEDTRSSTAPATDRDLACMNQDIIDALLPAR